ncbi:hypothetical protein [Nocardioides sp. SYSU D00038]|uniref:hypothetical protein n=1 Tax=Nocardioides sp. SYSU D00038 TaxID=2812554 RepID=UPI001967BB8C|nr:hypothetical protein [Nocardioides sp. SYSU D00038]
MRSAVLAIIVPAAVALAGCADDRAGGERPSKQPTGACRHDTETLLPAMQAAVPSDATFRASLRLRGGEEKLVMDGVIAYTPDGAEMDMTVQGPEGDFAAILVDERIFISDSAKGGPYQEIDASAPGVAQLHSQIKSMDVVSSFAAWEAGLEQVELVGEEEIDGEQVCLYWATVNTADAAEAEGEQLADGAPETVIYKVYLDAEDLMRRVTFGIGGAEGIVNATHWNEPVDIRVPKGH